MGIFFRVDRVNKYPAGSEICLRPPSGIPEDFAGIANKFSPQGYSSHGINYFINPVMITEKNSAIEFSLELFRRAFYPHLPSRYSSVFACDKYENSDAFRRSIADEFPEAGIYEIEGDETLSHRGDMSLLKNDCTTLVFADLLDLYWRGETVNPEPFWEIILPLPVKVLKRVS